MSKAKSKTISFPALAISIFCVVASIFALVVILEGANLRRLLVPVIGVSLIISAVVTAFLFVNNAPNTLEKKEKNGCNPPDQE